MLPALTAIFACQLAGELVVTAAELPIPGPVGGLLILLAGLVALGRIPEPLAKVADTLLGHLSLLFVPAGVGVLTHLELIARDAVPIGAALLISTLAAIAVTGLLMARLAPPEQPPERPEPPPGTRP